MNMMLQPAGGTNMVPGHSLNRTMDVIEPADGPLRWLSHWSFYEPICRVLHPMRAWMGDGPNTATVVVGFLVLPLVAILMLPLVAILLLPLFLVLVPAFLMADSAAVVATTRETDADDVEHDTLLGHAMH